MTKEDIIRLRDTAEQSRVQFFDKRSGNAERKERVTRDNKYDVSCEMVAQSNSRGGMIVVGLMTRRGASIHSHLWRYKRRRTCWGVWHRKESCRRFNLTSRMFSQKESAWKVSSMAHRCQGTSCCSIMVSICCPTQEQEVVSPEP